MKYRYSLSCPDCKGIDPTGCFDGGTFVDNETFDTPEQALNAGYEATRSTIWEFEVIDEEGKVIQVHGN